MEKTILVMNLHEVKTRFKFSVFAWGSEIKVQIHFEVPVVDLTPPHSTLEMPPQFPRLFEIKMKVFFLEKS